jgi:hypothetical protein
VGHSHNIVLNLDLLKGSLGVVNNEIGKGVGSLAREGDKFRGDLFTNVRLLVIE